MKKAIALALSLIMTLGLAACASSTNSASTSAQQSSGSAAAQSSSSTTSTTKYQPPKTVTLIVPYAAGGAMDLGARLVAKHASKYTDTNLVITNIAGASGTVGPAEMLKYPADGTYMCAMNPSPTYVPTKDKPLTYDYMTDFARVAIIMQDQRTIAVPKDNGKYETIEEFIDYVKQHPGEVTIGCSGTANDAYLTPYMLNKEAGIELTIVAYDGAADAKSDMLGGHIDALSVSYSEVLPMLENDQAIVLATAGTEPFEGLPGVPTLTEKGYNVVFSTNRGYTMKAGTDPAAIQYWSDIMGKLCQDEEFLAEASDMGFPIKFLDHNEYDALAEQLMTSYQEIFAELYG